MRPGFQRVWALLPEPAAQRLLHALPNSFTILALCFGMTAFAYADQNNIVAAIASVLVAGVLDACDGRVARATGSASKFGAELDSLSDVLCFGAAPSFILYKWGLAAHGHLGWIACLSLASACALRLARFNVTSADSSRPAWMNGYFQGVPAPAGAFLAFFPVYAGNAGLLSVESATAAAVVFVPAVALLMVSTLPTFAAKSLSRKALRLWFVPTLMIMAAVVAGLFYVPWPTLTLAAVVYVAAIALSRAQYLKKLRRLGV